VRGGSETPRRACRPASVAPEEWIMIPVPAIVAPELFEVVQEQLAENRQRARCGGGGERYLLQGLVVCRLCGYAYCGRRIRRKVRTDTLEAAVWREVERLLQDPDRLRAEYQRRLDQVQADCPERPDLASVEGQIAKLRRSLERLIDGYANEIITKDEFEPRIRGFRHRLQDLEDQRRHLADEVAMHRTLSLVIGQLGDFARRVRDRLAQADWHFRRDLIRLLVKRVEIDHNQVNIVFRVAPTFPAPEETVGHQDSVLPDCRRGGHDGWGHDGLGKC
jgi:site-specific DNA recombinase